MKKHLFLGILFILLLVIPFMKAYADKDFSNPALALFFFIVVLLATAAAWISFVKTNTL